MRSTKPDRGASKLQKNRKNAAKPAGGITVSAAGARGGSAGAGRKSVKGPVDFMLLATVIGLVVFGIIMVFSSSYYDALDKQGNAFYFLVRDIE